MAETFQAGDTVKLKSGGPIMTIEQVGEDGVTEAPSAWCAWFVATKLEPGVFPFAALVKA